jgi:hypothetical protein
MIEAASRAGSGPTIWRTVLVVGVFVAIGGGVALLLGEVSVVPVFVGLGVVTALGERNRWRQARARRNASTELGSTHPSP